MTFALKSALDDLCAINQKDRVMFYETNRKLHINEQARQIRSLSKRKAFLMRRFRMENPCCEICRCDIRDNKLVLDHDHKTGLYRGLLCHNCNVALGHFQDRIGYLLQAVEYLKQFLNVDLNTSPED